MSSVGDQVPAQRFLEQNTPLLRRRFPNLADLVMNSNLETSSSVQVRQARNGWPTAAVTRSTGILHVHSTFNPLAEAMRWVEQVQIDGDFAIVIGMGLGYHLDLLIERNPYLSLVVIEPDPALFRAALAARDQRRLLSHRKLDIMVTSDARAAATRVFQRHTRKLIHGQDVLIWPATSRYAPDFWPAFKGQLLDLVRATRTNVATNRAFSVQWIKNFFANIRPGLEDPGINALQHQFTGRPAIIAAAGPSLDKNAHVLAQAKGRALIIAAGSAINPLLNHGVEPDLLVSFDPGEANYRHFENLDTPTLPLVYVPTIYPRIVAEYRGPRFSSSMDVFPFISWFLKQLGEEKGLLSSGPSVANVCWHLAVQLGLNPIILVGQDLAYTGLKSHAEGAAHFRRIDIEETGSGPRYLEVESVDGGTVYTSRAMYAMKVWFEQRIPQAGPHRITIDATEGGAKIRGTQIMALRDAVDEYCQEAFHPHVTILDIHRREQSRLTALPLTDRLQVVLQDLDQHLQAILKVADTGLRDGKQLLLECKTKRLSEQRYREAVHRLDRLMKDLQRLTGFQAVLRPLIPHILDSITLSIQHRWQQETDLAAKGRELARQYLVLFGAVKTTGKRIAQLARRASHDLGSK